MAVTLDKYISAIKVKNVTNVLKFKGKVAKSLHIKATNNALYWCGIGILLIILQLICLTRNDFYSICNPKTPINGKNLILKRWF